MNMIITARMLRENFNACGFHSEMLEEKYPDGFDISGLWGTPEERSDTWMAILSDDILAEHLNWAVTNGVVPSSVHIKRPIGHLNLSGVDLGDIRLVEINADGLIAKDCLLSNSYISGSSFAKADMTWMNGDSSEIADCNMSGVILAYAEASRLSVFCTSFVGADLSDAVIRRSYFYRCDFSGADLSDAVLVHTILSDCNFTNAHMRGADLRLCDLSGTDMTGADLEGANIAGAVYNYDTKWPEGFRFENEAVRSTIL